MSHILNVLHDAESQFRKLLREPDRWNTLDVDYEPPRVERLWLQFNDEYRLYLHRIHPCAKPLFHPHPWPSGVRVVSGRYEMDVGYESREDWSGPPAVAATIILSAPSEYEMTDPLAWHSVKPMAVPSLSVMVTGRPWGRPSPRPSKKLNPLTEKAKKSLLKDFRSAYNCPICDECGGDLGGNYLGRIEDHKRGCPRFPL